MPVLVVLRGNSGCGKTSTAKALQKKFGRNTMRISADMVRLEILNVKDGADSPALPMMMEMLRYGRAHSEVVILEGILPADIYEPLFRLAVELYPEHRHAFYFDLPFEETMRRHQSKPNRGDFGEAEMRRWWREKDYAPTLRESLIPPEKDQNSLIENIYSLVQSER